ncbi:hypothetical protein BX600DRAFT_444897 [Xylariales sp. PMI_506]|nr:hypothetical protein BX600DRAFT_444897 [Xylariales sp. PMI_506]
MADFTTWNPVLGYPDGHNCTTQFWLGYDYCVEVNGGSSTSTTTSSSSTSSTSLPYPTQSGIISTCNKFNNAVSGDYCSKFAADNGITTAELYAWNTILGPNGENCATLFEAGVDYCIGVSSTVTTSVTTSATTSLPYPTQSGIISTCNKYNNAVSGDYCSEFASNNGITTAQLYAWNPILGPNGENCATLFQANVDYCVGVSSTVTTSVTTTATTSLPYPTQSGIISTCNKYNNAVSGDYCSEFASNNGITTAQLYAWNTILGPNGENCSTLFEANVDYCVGVAATSIPTQAGIAANCNKIVAAQSGDYCYIFAQNNGITTAQLYAWNPVLGANGENCSTEFQLGEGYCVSVSS